MWIFSLRVLLMASIPIFLLLSVHTSLQSTDNLEELQQVFINQTTTYSGITNQSYTEKFSFQADTVQAPTLNRVQDMIFLLSGCLTGFLAGCWLGSWSKGISQDMKRASRAAVVKLPGSL